MSFTRIEGGIEISLSSDKLWYEWWYFLECRLRRLLYYYAGMSYQELCKLRNMTILVDQARLIRSICPGANLDFCFLKLQLQGRNLGVQA